MSGVFTPNTKSGVLKLRLGFYEDLTTAPIVVGIEGMVKSAIVRRGTLDEVRQLFAANEFEAALLPTPDALRAPNHCIIPCSASSALGASRLMLLLSRKLPTEIHRVLVDTEDWGADSLGRVLLAKKLGVRAEFVRSERPLDPATYNFAEDTSFDAYLLTGRNCFMVRREAFAFTMDLTQTWYEITKLPYVMHCWVVQKGRNIGTLEKEIGDVSRRNESSKDLVVKVAEKVKIAESGVKAVYEKALIGRFDNMTIQSIRQFAKELTLARILMTPQTAVYTPPVVKRAGAV